jgi:deoxycytidine triphosphate deaminase
LCEKMAILSDKDINKYLEEGKISIDPLLDIL